MNTTLWLPIRYRDFYDVPRAFVVEYEGSLYLFDCPFDSHADEYPPNYSVYRLPSASVGSLEGSWEGLSIQGRLLRELPVSSVRFDATKRCSVDSDILRTL